MFRLCSCIARLLYFEGISYGFCDAYCRGHTGSRPERAVGSLLASGKVPGISSRLRSQLPAIHPKHAEPSRSRTWIAWKSVEGGARILAWVVATTRYRYVQHTALFSFVLQPILTLCTPPLPPGSLVKHHSHMNCVIRMVLVTRRFQTAPCQFCHSLQYLTWL